MFQGFLLWLSHCFGNGLLCPTDNCILLRSLISLMVVFWSCINICVMLCLHVVAFSPYSQIWWSTCWSSRLFYRWFQISNLYSSTPPRFLSACCTVCNDCLGSSLFRANLISLVSPFPLGIMSLHVEWPQCPLCILFFQLSSTDGHVSSLE